MAEEPVPLNPVFLSASVPDPRRHQKYFRTGDTVAIRDAVIALLTVVLPRTKLVFGGHPAITPMVKWVADQLNAFHRVRMFQSKFFRDQYLKDLELFRYEEVEAVAGDRDKSLLAMRMAMIHSENFSASFFIGGMEGVEHEYDLLREHRPEVPRFPVYTTGAAARLLWPKEWEVARESRPQLEQLRSKISYVGLFTGLLEDVSKGLGR
jgi:SLOG cluster3 family